MVSKCQSCLEKYILNKKKCNNCGLISMEAVGQFSNGSPNDVTIVYSCYNKDCEMFGRLLDENSNLMDLGSILLEKVAV